MQVVLMGAEKNTPALCQCVLVHMRESARCSCRCVFVRHRSRSCAVEKIHHFKNELVPGNDANSSSLTLACSLEESKKSLYLYPQQWECFFPFKLWLNCFASLHHQTSGGVGASAWLKITLNVNQAEYESNCEFLLNEVLRVLCA